MRMSHDPANPDSPSSTVSIAGVRGDNLEYLTLADSPVVLCDDAALFSDGVSPLVDWYGYTWPAIFTLMRSAGPQRLVTLLREAERNHPRAAGQQHDDATAVHLRLTES
jgi:hypothetical protein